MEMGHEIEHVEHKGPVQVSVLYCRGQGISDVEIRCGVCTGGLGGK